MGVIKIICTVTNKPVSTGIPHDRGTWSQTQIQSATLSRCPACGGTHEWDAVDAWVEDDD